MAFTALLDACVLYPALLRSLLLHLASTDLFRARWSDGIHQEWMDAVVRNRPALADKLDRTRRLMDAAIEDCLVSGHEPLIPQLRLPDERDRHVLAAAIMGRADVIVTFNLKHFPEDVLRQYRIEAQHPDVFIRHVLDLDQTTAIGAVRQHRISMVNPLMDPGGYLDALARQVLPESVAFLRPLSDSI